MNELNERGFVSIIGNKPYWITRSADNRAWLYIFDTQDKRWVQVRQLADADISTYRVHQIPEERAQFYHNGNHANPLCGKEWKDEPFEPGNTAKIGMVTPNHTEANLGKYKNSIISGISNAKDINELKAILFDSINQIVEATN